jgi:hypothetical protein
MHEKQVLELLERMEIWVMATLDQLTVDVNDLQNKVQTLIDGMVSTNPTDNQAQVDAIDSTVRATTATVAAAIAAQTPPAPTPAPTPAFVQKVAGETYADYTARVIAWDADVANASNQVTALDEATWDTLPVG